MKPLICVLLTLCGLYWYSQGVWFGYFLLFIAGVAFVSLVVDFLKNRKQKKEATALARRIMEVHGGHMGKPVVRSRAQTLRQDEEEGGRYLIK